MAPFIKRDGGGTGGGLMKGRQRESAASHWPPIVPILYSVPQHWSICAERTVGSLQSMGRC